MSIQQKKSPRHRQNLSLVYLIIYGTDPRTSRGEGYNQSLRSSIISTTFTTKSFDASIKTRRVRQTRLVSHQTHHSPLSSAPLRSWTHRGSREGVFLKQVGKTQCEDCQNANAVIVLPPTVHPDLFICVPLHREGLSVTKCHIFNLIEVWDDRINLEISCGQRLRYESYDGLGNDINLAVMTHVTANAKQTLWNV